MAAALLACPLCSQPRFQTLDSLRNGLISAATRQVVCPVCHDVLHGLDKFTIHLFSHSSQLKQQPYVCVYKSQQNPSTVCHHESVITTNDTVKGMPMRADQSSQTYLASETLETICESKHQLSSDDCSQVKCIPVEFNSVECCLNSSDIDLQHSGKASISSQALPASEMRTSLESFYTSDPKNKTPSSTYQIILEKQAGSPTSDVQHNLNQENSDGYSSSVDAEVPCEMEDQISVPHIQTADTTVFVDKCDDNICPSVNPEVQRGTGDSKTRCDICGFCFPDVSILHMHHQLVHADNERSSIHHSNRGLKDLPKLRLDERLQFPCHLCSKAFKMKGSLMVHLRVAHTGSVAGNILTSKSEGDLYSDDRKLVCSVCSKSFKKEQHLIQHMKTHDGKQWECDVCSKLFTTKYFLKKHKRLHTGEMPYSCAMCSKTFTFQQSYHKHLLYHSDDKPHVCAECDRAFKELSTLHNHQRIHTGEKPFGCETCD